MNAPTGRVCMHGDDVKDPRSSIRTGRAERLRTYFLSPPPPSRPVSMHAILPLTTGLLVAASVSAQLSIPLQRRDAGRKRSVEDARLAASSLRNKYKHHSSTSTSNSTKRATENIPITDLGADVVYYGAMQIGALVCQSRQDSRSY